MRIGLGQINSVVGDLAGNAEKMRKSYAEALSSGVDLLVFPELAVCGYPPEDLLYKKHFLQDNQQTIEKLAADCPQITIIVGFAEGLEDNGFDPSTVRHSSPQASLGTGRLTMKQSYNSAAILQDGRLTKTYRKAQLPNYGVFDEERYFQAGSEVVTINIKGVRAAITVCRDIWDIKWLADFLKNTGQIQLIVNISASPFHTDKMEERKTLMGGCARKFNCAIAYCNLVGGQDEIVFDGRSMIADSNGEIGATAKAFDEDLLIADIIAAPSTQLGTGDEGVQIKPMRPQVPQPSDSLDEIYQALVLGTRDYARKNGFEKVLLGLSGGIDSSVTAAVAAIALGAENVVGITMPSKFNSPETKADAEKVAKNLGIGFLSISIEPTLEQFNRSLGSAPGWDNKGVAYENLQARIRGTTLMSLSNQYGALVLTSGNKSETAVGYATLYGDTAGGFAVIKDVPKTVVYKLAEHINKITGREVIPASVLSRAPSAELKAGQKDTDSLPDYDLLDEILKGYVEEDKSAEELIEAGLPKEVVHRVIRMVDRNEYKRRQSPPGIKITPKAFGKDRRLPITNRYSQN